MPDVLYKVVYEMPPRPGEAVELKPEVDLVLAIALAKNPDDRFDSGVELASVLDSAIRGEIDDALRARAEKLLAGSPWSGAG